VNGILHLVCETKTEWIKVWCSLWFHYFIGIKMQYFIKLQNTTLVCLITLSWFKRVCYTYAFWYSPWSADLGYIHIHLYLKDSKQMLVVLVLVFLRDLGVFGWRVREILIPVWKLLSWREWNQFLFFNGNEISFCDVRQQQ
jgi:hypothetical protein